MRWGGSKARKSKDLVGLIPHDIEHYFEPFCGYFCVFRRLITMSPHLQSFHLNDINSDLIAWIHSIRDGDFVERLREVRDRLLPELDHEDEIRAEFEASKHRWIIEEDTFAWFLLHVYAVGQYVSRNRSNIASFDPGYFNHGLQCETVEKALSFRRMLKRATVTNEDALSLLRDLNKKADASHFVYLDPPYIPADRDYGLYQHEMTDDEQVELAEILKQAKFRFMLSMGDSPGARDLYIHDQGFQSPFRKDKGFRARQMLYSYTGHARKQVQGRGKSGKTSEWVIMNYDIA